MQDLRWATPTRDDDPAWLGLLAAMEAVDDLGETYELTDLDDEWNSVWSHPDTDALFGWSGDDLVAFAWLKAMPGEREAHRVSCWGGVHPAHRRQGVGTELFGWMLEQATEIATRFDPALPTRVQVNATDQQPDVAALAARHEFAPVRGFLEIARSTAHTVPELPGPSDLDTVPWCVEIDEEVRLAHRESFQDHWGSEPRSRDQWVQWYTGHRGFRADLSRVAIHRASGQVASLVLCAAYPADWDHTPVEVWVNTVATRREWRGKGVARWLLSECLRLIECADDGFERAVLGVDEENPTGALRLYRALGFDVDVRRVALLERGPLA